MAVALTGVARRVTARRRRELTFAVVGGSVLVVSFAVLFTLVSVVGLSAHLAYVIQTVVAVELNFALNERVTWRDARSRTLRELAHRWLLFHVARVATIPANQLLFSALVVAGCQYLLANAICVAASTSVNYVVGSRWVFVRRPQGELR
jgi:dolichol-phosphate mannosyltransferase